jgi:hypothetical protein
MNYWKIIRASMKRITPMDLAFVIKQQQIIQDLEKSTNFY